MKRFGMFLILLALFVTACSSNQFQLGSQTEIEEPGSEAAAPTTTSQSGGETASEPVDAIDPLAQANVATLVRERDWKLGNEVDPVVTVIEYGDFQ